MSKKPQYLKKIVMLGDGGVGKTSLVKRFKTGQFNPAYLITLGASITKKEIDFDHCLVTLAIWDIGGQEMFQKVHSKYFIGSEGALAVCDVTDFTSFQNLSNWIKSFRKVVGDKPVIFLANKIDLKDQKVTEHDISALSAKFSNSQFILTSARNGTNTNEAFSNIARLILDSSNTK